MSKEKYYVMHLDDYAAAQFTSFGKMYFGTLEEIGHFIRLLEKDPETAEAHKDTIEGYYKFLQGDTKVTHKVAYQDVKLLTPVRVRGSTTFVLVFGHTPTNHFQNAEPMRIWKGDDAIGIDCGCGYDYGRLACLRLDDMKEFYSER